MSDAIEAWVLNEYHGISPRKFVLLVIAKTANDAGWAFGESLSLVARKVSLHERQVRSHIGMLKSEGALRVLQPRGNGGGWLPNVYQVLAPTVDRDSVPPILTATVRESRPSYVDSLIQQRAAQGKQITAEERRRVLSSGLPSSVTTV